MGNRMTPVRCKLSECMFYKQVGSSRDNVYCTSQDKPHFLSNNNCPLFRLDWERKMSDLRQVKSRLNTNSKEKKDD